MTISLKLKFEKQGQLVVNNLEKEYFKKLEYNGAIKTVYSKFVNAIGEVKLGDNFESKGCGN